MITAWRQRSSWEPHRDRLAEIARQCIVVDDAHYGRVEDVQRHILHMVCYAFMELPEFTNPPGVIFR